ncbi:MAG: ubiquinone/menaquinone biosynthesis methyltransferase [Planctomycetes bacterium]|nr:ubiquinone/menaquinone biosynthesis methyltransferase [Planctomycetota bacterium]
MPSTPPPWTPDLLESPHDAPDKAGRVRGMFNEIAPRYELVNALFSAGRDRAWRKKAVALARVRADDEVLDIACGTGDFARAFSRAGARLVVGSDFAHEMLALAPREGSDQTVWCEADALDLPFRDECFSIASCAFGVRNFQNLDRGLREMHRVLRPGGRVVILEFTRPGNRAARAVYELYANRFMPRAAAWVSGDRCGAYRYLPRSVVSFPNATELCARLAEAGFSEPRAVPLTFGVVTVYVARRD